MKEKMERKMNEFARKFDKKANECSNTTTKAEKKECICKLHPKKKMCRPCAGITDKVEFKQCHC